MKISEILAVAGKPGLFKVLASGSASIGFDHGSPVSQLYDDLFSFTGKLHELEIQLVAREPRDLAEMQQRAENARQ